MTAAGAVPGARPAPKGVNPSQPSSARVFDYLLGGKDNYEADRVLAQHMLEVAPDTRTLAWFSRRFLTGATQLAAEKGVRQFVDMGAGLPTSPNVHEVAQKVDSAVRVASVDFDPIVYAHANAMLDGEPDVTAILGDFRDPGNVLHRLRTEAKIDLDQPIAMLVVGVLHFVMDDERPADLIARYRDAMTPGSYLAFTHGSTDTSEAFMHRATTGTHGSPAQIVFRSAAAIEALFEGFEILDPGIVPIQKWIGDDLPKTRLDLLGAVCRKPDGPG
ncbi:SAM-dependent methyltransferase [Nocardia sp. BMG51109]|uniref:SAM-dependent methyltransferase n=1 Tax=Nocardia sp. BMG51109 TaxID=1056816 RepID=UPI000466FF86|nr:SAM-dependent methyltransferase [Nocardia sp. BMG51109]